MAESQSRQLHRLSALRIAKLVDPGYHVDGGDLYVQISGSGSRSWIYQFKLFGRSREMGLGPMTTVWLAEACAEADRCRALAQVGQFCVDINTPVRLHAKRVSSFRETRSFGDSLHLCLHSLILRNVGIHFFRPTS
jgi:hypothetical protein